MKPVRVLGREYSMEILGATENSTSVTRLSESLDIPIATCYRRVSELATVGLLEETSTDEDGASGATRYRRTTDAVGIRFAPVPSLFAWTCVREAVGADASALAVSTRDERQSQVGPVPTGMPTPDGAAATEERGSVESNE